MQRRLSFYLACHPDGATSCQEDRQQGCAPRSDLIDTLRLKRWAPDGTGEQQHSHIEDDDDDNDQNVSQQDPTPMHLPEMGFHSHTSCLIALVGGGSSALLAEYPHPLVFCREVVVNDHRKTLDARHSSRRSCMAIFVPRHMNWLCPDSSWSPAEVPSGYRSKQAHLL